MALTQRFNHNRLKELMLAMRGGGWMPALSEGRFNLVLLNKAVGQRLQKAMGANCPNWADVEDFDPEDLPKSGSILVLSARGERETVEQIQKLVPGSDVVSGTYEFSLQNLRVAAPKNGVPDNKPLLLMAAPSTDSEFVARVLSQNTPYKPQEYISRFLVAWLSVCEDFCLKHYIRSVSNRFEFIQLPSIFLMTDAIAAIEKHHPRLLTFIRRFSKQTGLPWLVATDDNLWQQAVVSCILGRTTFRSFWNVPVKQEKRFPAPKVSGVEAFESYKQVHAYREKLKAVEATAPGVFVFAVRDFIDGDKELLAQIENMLGVSLDRGQALSQYRLLQHHMSSYYTLPSKVRGELIDRTGLHKNLFD